MNANALQCVDILRCASCHGVGNDPVYNLTAVFQTFPFPDDLSPDIPATDYKDDSRAVVIKEVARRAGGTANQPLAQPKGFT